MGAFILFPILAFILFIAGVMGVTDYVHAETLVHAAAQTAVAAAAQDALASSNRGDYTTIGTSSLKVDSNSASSTVRSMLSGKPYITSWSCGVSGIDYACDVKFSVSIPLLGGIPSSTSASASAFIVGQGPNPVPSGPNPVPSGPNPVPSGPPNISIFDGGSTHLEKGWTTTNPAPLYHAGYGSSPRKDGGWANVQTNGSASYSFTVAANQSSTITYGIPAGGHTNGSPTNIYVNDMLRASVNTGTGSSPASSSEYLWSDTFGPGIYRITLTGGNTNVYGLWASNLSAITPFVTPVRTPG